MTQKRFLHLASWLTICPCHCPQHACLFSWLPEPLRRRHPTSVCSPQPPILYPGCLVTSFSYQLVPPARSRWVALRLHVQGPTGPFHLHQENASPPSKAPNTSPHLSRLLQLGGKQVYVFSHQSRHSRNISEFFLFPSQGESISPILNILLLGPTTFPSVAPHPPPPTMPSPVASAQPSSQHEPEKDKSTTPGATPRPEQTRVLSWRST